VINISQGKEEEINPLLPITEVNIKCTLQLPDIADILIAFSLEVERASA